ncbi:minor tail protein GP26 [Streptococcus pneumoniae]|nr:minor tail protein GP26 [Streptococcus pneumoniae]
MADGKVVIQVDMDGDKAQSGVKRLKGMVGGLAESGTQLGSVFKSVLGANIVSGALISGIQSLGGVIKGVFSTALDEGAKLQQSFGGIDTLYSGAEATMKQYAAEAAAAGISANTYAEQAVSFGASLKQALGGDVVKAAEAANKAILAMADNSAKMGTDIGSIQNAFQGFAKGNYTMLDNLKLGYGGTKQEMERLLKDASKLEKAMGKKFDINNFADIVEAIDLVQQELGVAGVAAQEAQTTFSGSFAAMKASASNFLANLSLGEDIGPALKTLVSTTSTFLLGNFLPMVGNIMRQLPQAIEVAMAEAGPKIEEGFRSLFAGIGVDDGVFDVIKDTFRDVVVTVQSLFGELTSEGNGFKDLLQGISNVITFVNAVIQELARGFQFVLDSFADTGTISNVYQAFKDLSEAATEVAQNLGEAIPWEMIGTAVGQIVNGISILVSWFSKLAQSISPDMWRGLITGVVSFAVALKGIKTGLTIARGLKSAFDFGKNLVSLISNTLSLTVAQATNAAASTAMSAGNTAVGTSAGAAASSVLKLGAGLLMVGAGVLLATTGIYLLVQAAIQLSNAGAGAILTMVGMAIGIAALAAVFAFLGPALTAGAVGILAFGAAIALIGVGVYAVSVGLALLAVQLPVISEYGLTSSIALIALGGAMLVLGAGALVAGAGLLVLGAGALVAAAGAVAFGAGLLIASVGVAAFGLALGVCAPAISTFVDAISKIIETLSGGLSNILDAISRVIQSVGDSALKAGQGFKALAEGVVMITNTSLGDMVASLGAVALGVGKIAGYGSDLSAVGNGMTILSNGMMMFAQSATIATGALANFPGLISNLSVVTGSAPASFLILATAVKTAGTLMATSMQASMAQILVVVNNGMVSIVQSVRNNGSQMVAVWRISGQQLVSATQGFVNSANNTLSQISQGVNLHSNGLALMASLKSGIDSGWSQITSSVSNMAKLIKDHKGPVSYDRRLLIENGSAIMAGLNQGIQTGWRNVMDNISSMAGTIQDVINDDYSDIGWQIGLGISDGLNSSMDKVTGRLGAIRDHVNDFSLKSKNLLTGATATMSSQLKVETLRGKTPKDETSSRQEAYIAHSTSLLSDMIDSLSELKEQVAQGQMMVLDTGALVGGTAYAYDEAVGNIQTLRGRHRL